MANRFDVIVLSSISWSCLRHVFLALALLGLTSCAGLSQRFYSAEPIEAWIVDEKTGKPLEGVIVVAHWKLMRYNLSARVPAGTMMLLETVTDVNGRFSFPAWGPLQNTSDGFLDHEDPMLIFFKPAYRSIALSNHRGTRAEDKPSKRRSEWSTKTIKLPPFEGTTEDYATHIADRSSFVASTLDWRGNCNIAKTPLLARAVDSENAKMEAQGIRKSGFLLDGFSPDRLRNCELQTPPSGAMRLKQGDGTVFFGFPQNAGSSYTGCVRTWIIHENGDVRFDSTYRFEKGKLAYYRDISQSTGAALVTECSYTSGNVTSRKAEPKAGGRARDCPDASKTARTILALSQPTYRAEAIEGQVVDRHGPLQGVIVVAHWELQGGPWNHERLLSFASWRRSPIGTVAIIFLPGVRRSLRQGNSRATRQGSGCSNLATYRRQRRLRSSTVA